MSVVAVVVVVVTVVVVGVAGSGERHPHSGLPFGSPLMLGAIYQRILLSVFVARLHF